MDRGRHIGDLLDECLAYAGNLEADGVTCELVAVPGMYHTAEGVARNAPSMKKFHASMVNFLRTHLETERSGRRYGSMMRVAFARAVQRPSS